MSTWINFRMIYHIRQYSQSQGVARSVLYVLGFHADYDGKCWPGITQICEDSGWGRDAVFKAIKELEELGELQVTRAPRKVNRYRITVEERPHPEYERASSADYLARESRARKQSF